MMCLDLKSNEIFQIELDTNKSAINVAIKLINWLHNFRHVLVGADEMVRLYYGGDH